jgi:hypothetical protein
MRNGLSSGFSLFCWQSAKQTFPLLMSILRVSTIPHLLSFSTPEHGGAFCSVEAKLGLSFL